MWSDLNGTILVFWWWWKWKQSPGKSISNFKSRNNFYIHFSSARLSDASWCAKMIWLSTFIEDRAIRSLNQSLEYYCALTHLTLLTAIRKLKPSPVRSINYISKSSTWILRFDGEYFQTAGSSKFSHQWTLGMGNYKNKALTTGCHENSSCYVKTELMNMETLQWSNGPDFPFLS